MAALGLRGADTDAFLLPSECGGPLDYANWRRRGGAPAVIAAGFYVSEPDLERPGTTHPVPTLGFHDLRRANATAMVRDKVDMKAAQRRLGHSDPRLTLAV